MPLIRWCQVSELQIHMLSWFLNQGALESLNSDIAWKKFEKLASIFIVLDVINDVN